MVYLYYESKDATFLLWEIRTDPPYVTCITTEEACKYKSLFWSKHLPTSKEELIIDRSSYPDFNLNWSDEYPSISLLLTFNTLEDYFTWADQDHPELFV